MTLTLRVVGVSLQLRQGPKVRKMVERCWVMRFLWLKFVLIPSYIPIWNGDVKMDRLFVIDA